MTFETVCYALYIERDFSWNVVINVVKIKLHRKSKEVYFSDINDEISFLAIPIT